MDETNSSTPTVEIKTSYRVPKYGDEVYLVNPKGAFNHCTWVFTDVVAVDHKNKRFTTAWKIHYEDNGVEMREDTFPFDSFGILWFDKNSRLPVLWDHLNNYKWRNYGRKRS